MKNALKKSLSVFLAVAIIFSSAYVGLNEIDFNGIFAIKAEAIDESDLFFELNSDGVSYSLVMCEHYAAVELVIPSTYNGKPVTSIGDFAFSCCTSLTAIEIPDSVTSISNNAFDSCTSLTTVVIPDSVTRIGDYALYNCKSLTAIEIPDSVTSIGDFAFSYCESLTAIEIPDSVTSIGSDAFSYCTSLTTVVIPDSVTRIDSYAFNYCESLTSIEIPDSVTSIGDCAFYECTSLKDVYYDGTEADWENITIGSDNSYLTNATIHYHQHTYVDWVIDKAPTCTEAGIKYSECSGCGETVIEEIDALGHDFSEEWTIDKEATFTEAGSKSRHCMNCNAKTDVTVIPANFGDVMFVAQEGSTCDGKLTYVVYLKAGTSVNGAIVNVEFDDTALEVYEGGAYLVTDSYGDFTQKVPGFYESGICWNTTNIYSMAFVNISAKNITKDTPFMKITFDIKEGYTEADVKFSCKEFNSNNPEHNVPNTETPVLMFEETADITISEHISSDWIVDDVATVFDVGYEHRECINCGEFLETNEIPQLVCQKPELESLIQNESGLVFSWSAVEGADEYQVYRKTDSGEWTLLAAVDSASTTYIDTNVEDGKIYYYTVQAVNEAGTLGYNRVGVGCEFHVHSFGDWIITTPATCMTDGERYRVCSGCGDEEYEAIRFLGHDYSTEWTIDIAPTCTTEGSKSRHCSRCDSVADVTVIEISGHSYGDWVITKAPTCTEQGSLSKTCSVCGDVKIEATAKNPHSYSTEWTIDLAPTCTEAGSKSHHCIACGDKTDVTVITALGHNYEITDVAEVHPHTVSYKCSYCDGTKIEQNTASDCLECNFTVTYVKETDSYKIVSYTGAQESVVIPAIYNGCNVTAIANGCFKGNTTIKSVEIADGVTSIGSLAFMNCTSLEKVVIPASVASIGSQTFYKFSGTIYCERDSYAHQYAVENNINYFLLSIIETDNTIIDYDNFMIFTTAQCSDDILDILGVSETAIAVPIPSITYGSLEIYGTGTVVTVFDGDDYIGDFTLIVEGDLNGDSVCDVLDASIAHLYSVGMEEPSENEILAANGCASEELNASSYQNVVNMMLVS